MRLKKIFLSLLIVLLAGCANHNNTLSITPTVVMPQADPSLMGITINVGSADQRQDTVLVKLNRDGQLVSLYPSRDVRFLLQEVLEKQMTARGYMIGLGNGIELKVIINKLAAEVTEGNLRYSISSTADITVQAQTKNGSTQMKTYRANYSVEGAFNASNQKIAAAINSVLSDVIADMAQDTNIHQFIKQNSR